MKNIINKIISLFLVFLFVLNLFPPRVYSQSNTGYLPSQVKGFDRSVFDYHFSKADREINPEQWFSQARRGIDLAISSWEIFSLDLFETLSEKNEAKRQLERWSEEELEFRFSQWLTGRFFGTEARNITDKLSVTTEYKPIPGPSSLYSRGK